MAKDVKADTKSIQKAGKAALPRILLLHGPNLNLLGTREPEKYGSTTLEQLETSLTARAAQAGFQLDCLQSNHEGVLVDRIHATRKDGTVACIINAGALTHTSVALRDAFSGASLSFLEVHITNVHAREEFRHHSFLSAIARGIIVGFGVRGYDLALDFLTNEYSSKAK
jgi:3-dehydroquinate dehydratase-2